MTILLTGAAGFIGSNTCEFLVQSGHTVIGLDNFDSFYPKEIKENNIAGLQKEDGFLFYEADIRNRAQIHKIFSDNKIDLVIHLAAKAGVRPSIENIEDYYDVNINGTVSLLETMKTHQVKKMLFASSSSVYGNNREIPFSEKHNVDNPISPYASTKKSGELLCHVYSHLYGFDITCLRFFTVYGPRQRPDLAIHKFTDMIFNGETIPFYGDGSTGRDYTYITDIVNGINRALNNLDGYRIYNLGGSEVTDLKSMVRSIEETLGKKARLKILAAQMGDVNITFADISKAKAEIGYDPHTPFNKGIKLFIEWYLKNRK